MLKLDLASTISMLATVARKKGEAACRRFKPSRPPCFANASLFTAEPKPYQPGSMTRACDHENTQGMARRSAMWLEAVREAGLDPIFKSAISLTGVDWRK